jgi:hypothetical protein
MALPVSRPIELLALSSVRVTLQVFDISAISAVSQLSEQLVALQLLMQAPASVELVTVMYVVKHVMQLADAPPTVPNEAINDPAHKVALLLVALAQLPSIGKISEVSVTLY